LIRISSLSKKTSLAQRTITSISWNFVGNSAQIVVGFVRSVLLARLLPVEVFGVYAWARSVVMLSAVLPSFGLGSAFLHRAPETEDEDQAAAAHFTLQVILTLTWAVGLILVTLIFTGDESRRTALLWITVTAVGVRLVGTPRLILIRRVVHRRLTLVQLIDSLLSSIVAIVLAWRGATLWALLATNLVTFLVNIIGFYVWHPVWRPRLTWNLPVMRYFLRFGSRNLAAAALLYALDRVDDLWVGAYLGNRAMGFYSRAYTFATYSRKVLASPINLVTIGTYAELKGDRKRLSQAFFRVNAFLVRSGFLLAGSLALIAPEFIRLLLGAKWLPMLSAFRLMLVYTLFDPLKLTVANMFVAVGKPEQIVRARSIQLAVLVAGLLLLGPLFGIAGVALAVDAMLVVGIVILLWQARTYVDFSFVRLFAAPGVALVVGMALARGAVTLPGVLGSDWRTGFVKITVFLTVYGVALFTFERRQLFEAVRVLSSHWGRGIGRRTV
jgi:O-antigen/teichoic acid export membrane protein